MGGRYLGQLAVVFALARSVGGQTGGGSNCCASLTPRVVAATIQAHEGEGIDEHRWLQAAVLWRGAKPNFTQYSGDRGILAERARVEARFRSEAAGRTITGGFYTKDYNYAEYDRDRTKLWVFGREFNMPSRDSALVVMVDRSDDERSGPVIVGTEYVAAELARGYWGKVWTSGDTTFSVRSANPDKLLLAALRTNPRLREFIDSSNGPP